MMSRCHRTPRVLYVLLWLSSDCHSGHPPSPSFLLFFFFNPSQGCQCQPRTLKGYRLSPGQVCPLGVISLCCFPVSVSAGGMERAVQEF